ncbi:menaquinone biosynthetic enzyme MqnA/MqnD family protein [Phorcysia thermohydrogeniphila]|uniref:Chorismate dehydratase n=1 Tax=Phorcysia thermohydrogeniphila TaxID=936138 RepID=A0A4R1GEL3_9BACT|nr:menaquinone biosynthesis protein [Phorcysia thermohydrogeniphila]TCK05251.1 futalosine synthase [Phorcysia thermohydrogeniphila]
MLRVGKIEYLNTVPVYYGFLSGKVPSDGIEFVEDVPSELNRLLREGKLDISVISSYEYLTNSDKYLLFPNFSISAKKRVLSVLFLSTVPIHQLHRKDVWLTRSSMTSRELLKFLLREVYGVEPNFRYYSLKVCDLPKNPTALLTIGDEALRFLKTRRFSFVYDLAEEWHNLYGLPFVFAVWAVRKDSYEREKEAIGEFYRRLSKSREIGIGSFSEICSRYSKKLQLPEKMCKNYLENLIFSLGEEELESLEKFAQSVKVKAEFSFLPVSL